MNKAVVLLQMNDNSFVAWSETLPTCEIGNNKLSND